MPFSKLFFLSFLFVACFNSQEQKPSPLVSEMDIVDHGIVSSEKLKRADNGLMLLKKELFSGISRTIQNGAVVEEISYRKGRMQGVRSKWFSSDQLSYEANYSEGKLHGLARSWWKDGTLRSASNFKNGTAHGVQEQWYRSGKPFKRLQLVNGQEEGLQQAWRENGKVYANYEATNGRIFGLKRANLCFGLEDEEVISNAK